RDKNKAGIERLQEQYKDYGQKYQKLDHLDDTIEPLSNSTFVSSNKKSRKSKSSDTTSLFDDWDNDD
ncbi:unnamed protein product, partial [Rhizophagus irregularis]